MAKECPDCGYSKRVTLSDGTRACGDCGYAFKAGKTAPAQAAPATSSAQNTEHNTTIEIVDVAPFELDGIGRCSCGWTETVRGHWPSEARRLALIAVLDHKNAAAISAQPEDPTPYDPMADVGAYTVTATEYAAADDDWTVTGTVQRTYVDVTGKRAIELLRADTVARVFNQAVTEYSVTVATPDQENISRAATKVLDALVLLQEAPAYSLPAFTERICSVRELARELARDLQEASRIANR